MKILVTGSAGFIGYHVSKKLIELGHNVVGIDNLNHYYDVKLKKNRNLFLKKKYKNKFHFYKIDINNFTKLNNFFKKEKINSVIHLAAQAGVRMSINKPNNYFQSNVVGFFNILKCCIKYKIKHLVAASSSSVYGDQKNNTDEHFETSKPLQFYAATKKSNEVMAYSFSNIYKLPISIVRLFTVYGPWGRPDMALFKFTSAMINKQKIYLYNNGQHYRDFTYIDDIVNGIVLTLNKVPISKKSNSVPFEIYNLGNNKTISIKKIVKELESKLKIKARIKLVKKQKGDVFKTSASIIKSKKILGYSPKIEYKTGVSNFIDWYKNYFNLLIKTKK